MNKECDVHWELVPDDSDDVPIVRWLAGGQGRTAEDVGESGTTIFAAVVVGTLVALACLVF